MSYVNDSDLVGLIPPDFLTQALDDNGDGVADDGLLDLIIAQASEEIDGYIGRRYPLPLLTPYPEVITSSAKALAAEALYKRRGIEDQKNPWSAKARSIRMLLQSIAQGTTPLSHTLNRQDPSASIVTEPMGTTVNRRYARNSA